MKKRVLTAIIISATSLNGMAANSVDSDGYVTQLFPPVTETIYKAGTPNVLNSGAPGSMIPTVNPGETLRIQFLVPPGATTAKVGGTSNLWNSGGSGKQPVFGFYACNPGKASSVQSRLAPASGGFSQTINRPSNVPSDEPFYAYLIVHNPSSNPYGGFYYSRFTQDVSIGDSSAYSNWVNKGRCLPTTDNQCSFVTNKASSPNLGSGSCSTSTGGDTTTTTTPTTTMNTLAVSKTGSGTVTSSPAGINCGTSCLVQASGTIILTATPAEGSSFLGWSGDCSGTSTQCSVSVTSYKRVSASFGTSSSTTPSTGITTDKCTPVAASSGFTGEAYDSSQWWHVAPITPKSGEVSVDFYRDPLTGDIWKEQPAWELTYSGGNLPSNMNSYGLRSLFLAKYACWDEEVRDWMPINIANGIYYCTNPEDRQQTINYLQKVIEKLESEM